MNMKTIVVLGMHRSATSLVARTLNSEVHMGEHLLTGLTDNPKGHYENIDILNINDKILIGAEGSWYAPPTLEKILESGKEFEKEMIDIISRETQLAKEWGFESWGFKDPRTALTIECWLPFLENPQFVVCYRSPMDIAKSLEKRNGFDINYSLKLVDEYNNRINNFIKKWLTYDNCINHKM